MSDSSKITVAHAEQIHSDLRYADDQGEISIDGEKFEWWANHEAVWFYEPGRHGDDTIKRFSSYTSFREES